MVDIHVQRLTTRRIVSVVLCVFAILAGVVWGLGGQSGSAASPKLVLTAPEEALAGEPIEVQLVIDSANGISAFDVTVGYDTEAASLQSVQARDNDIAALGKDVRLLGPVEVPGGVAVGAYACPVASCADPVGTERVKEDGSGTIRLATFTVVAWEAGPLTLDLSSARFADGAGRPVEVDLAGAVVTVQVMPNGEGQ